MKNFKPVLTFISFVTLLSILASFPLIILAFEEHSEDEVYTESVIKNSVLTDEEKGNIIVSEFYPNPVSGESEWVEFYNANSKEVLLENWKIDDVIGGGSSPITFSYLAPKESYFVIELSKSILNNSGEDAVSLLDENDFPLHVVNFKKTIQGSSIQNVTNFGWFITDKLTKGEENLSYTPLEISNPKSKVISSTNDIYSILPDSLSVEDKEKIEITEFYPYPQSDESEWVEIYNGNGHTVAINNWYIDDEVEKGGSPFKFSITLEKKSYGLIKISKSLLNNTGDSLSLLDETGFPLHIVKYNKSVKGSSIQKLGSKWYITSENTKEKKNLDYESYKEPSTLAEEFISDSLLKTSNEKEQPGQVLGTSVRTEYRTIPVYNLETEKYLEFSGTGGSVYVVTEKQMPNSYEKLLKFFEKALW